VSVSEHGSDWHRCDFTTSSHERHRRRLHASAERNDVNRFGHSFAGELLRPKSSQTPHFEISLSPARDLPHVIGSCVTVAALNPEISLGNAKPANGL
jgi:hypothetical protein